MIAQRPDVAIDSIPKELRALLALDDLGSLTSLLGSCEWGTLDRLARQQRLTGRLLQSLRQADATTLPPPELLTAWEAQARRHSAVFRRAIQQLDRLATSFHDQGVTPTLLKGPVLVLLGLRRSWERPFSDLDLLVARADIRNATVAMHSLGYHQSIDSTRHDWARMSHYHDPRFHHVREALPVEVHWDLLRPDDPLSFDVTSLATEELPLPSGRRLRRPDDADLLAHVCLHFWGDRATGQPRGIAQLLDVADLTERLDSGSWPRFWARANRRGHTDVLAVVLALVRVLLDRTELDRFPVVASRAATPQLRDFALRRVCGQRPVHVQLLSPHDDVHFGLGRHLKQRLPWLYGPDSPMRWWPGVALTRLASAALRSGRELGRIYGVEPSVRLRLVYLWELGRLVVRAMNHPLSTTAELRIDRWAQSFSRDAARAPRRESTG